LLHACNSRESAAAECGGMSPPHYGARVGRPSSGVRLVRELPLVLEPVTRDPFIDDGRPGPAVPTVHAAQLDRVRESLLRCPGSEERT
jgi:hypothetical protein